MTLVEVAATTQHDFFSRIERVDFAVKTRLGLILFKKRPETSLLTFYAKILSRRCARSCHTKSRRRPEHRHI